MIEQQILNKKDEISIDITNYAGLAQITVDEHQGGTWVVQRRKPGGKPGWMDLEVEFSDNGCKIFYIVPTITYRLSGGNKGATAYIVQIPFCQALQDNMNNFEGVSLV